MAVALFIEPDAAALEELASAWAWLVPADLRPIRFTRIGDVFYEDPDGAILWLDTNCGVLAHVADSLAAFEEALVTEIGVEWLLTPLVEALEAAGKHAPPGYCYSPEMLPIFAEGRMAVETMHPVPAREHYGESGGIHRQIQDLPDGTKVQIQDLPDGTKVTLVPED